MATILLQVDFIYFDIYLGFNFLEISNYCNQFFIYLF